MPIADANGRELTTGRFAVNTKGHFSVLREAAKLMRSGGRIVQSVVRTGRIQCTSRIRDLQRGKERRRSLSLGFLCKELKGRNITVNCVAPGRNGDGANGFKRQIGGNLLQNHPPIYRH